MLKYFRIAALGVLLAPALALADPVGSKLANPSATWPPLPAAVSSLGAVVADGYLYVYGGHAGKTHSYDTQSVLGTFQRLKLDGGMAWEPLMGGPIVQGMNLAAHNGKVIRVGGMQPRNEPGKPADNISLAECAAYDPKAGRWEPLPALPAGRSSHDVVTVGDTLVVVGGWDQRGAGNKPVWHDTALQLDLSKPGAAWKPIPQPFRRRALTAAAVGTRVYALCGLDADANTTQRVEVLDTETGKWSEGPKVPGTGRVGFSPAATVVAGQLIINTSDGVVSRLNAVGDGWEKLATADTNRMVHRLVPFGRAVVLVGGASKKGNVAALEVVRVPEDAKK